MNQPVEYERRFGRFKIRLSGGYAGVCLFSNLGLAMGEDVLFWPKAGEVGRSVGGLIVRAEPADKLVLDFLGAK